MLSRRLLVTIAALVGALGLTAGLVAAGALPGPVDDTPAADHVSSEGTSHADSHADDHEADAGEHDAEAEGQGSEISALAHETDPGPCHGAVVSDAASGGVSTDHSATLAERLADYEHDGDCDFAPSEADHEADDAAENGAENAPSGVPGPSEHASSNATEHPTGRP